ncbi:MAG: hypothetical protein ABI647_07850 [Gemmatimonadota bacterium]
MPNRVIDVDGARWEISPTGRHTQYVKDEFSILFTKMANGTPERRMARYSPQGVKNREQSLAELSDADLATLLRRSQPAWTSVELGYRR